MGLPSINIAFQSTAAAAVQKSQKGVVALIVRDAAKLPPMALTSPVQLPAGLGKENERYIKRTFLGYVNPPRRVLVCVADPEAEDLSGALGWLATQSFDYLAGPLDISDEECAALAGWVKSRRFNDCSVCKAVLPNLAADSEAVVNVTTGGICAGGEVFDAAAYCSRVAGLLAGTPMTISCTYAPLPEVEDVARLTREEMDRAVDKGELIFYHDGEKVKVARGVNSLVTTTADKDEAWKKIKVVEALDMIQFDIRRTCEDAWIGKYPNSYDNKQLLCTAIKGYLAKLEREGVLKYGYSTVDVDAQAQELYLQSTGTDTSKLTEAQIREANTADKVFLTIRVKVLDAIEEIHITIYK